MALKKILGLELGTTLDTSATFTAGTASSVKTFQEKYATLILIPNGLSAGTGVVGPSTRAKLNALAGTYYVKLSDFTVPSATVKNVFTTTLSIGSTGDNVILLRTILNSDPKTKVATSSSSIENVYDAYVADAVSRFQVEYASEILAPSGLTTGTGVVGPATRKKLNAIVNGILASAQAVNATNNSSSGSPAVTTTQKFSINNNVYTASNSGTTNSSPDVGTILTYPYYDAYGNCMVDIEDSWGPQPTATSSCTGTYNPGTNNTPSYGAPVYDYGTPTATVDPTAKQITGFAFPSSATTNTVIDEKGKTITIYVAPTTLYQAKSNSNPFLDLGSMFTGIDSNIFDTGKAVAAPSYDMTSIAPTITFSGSSTSPASGVALDFSNSATNPINYTVTALDGSTTTYKVSAVRVTCPNYYQDGIPFGGKITDIKKVLAVYPGGEAGQDATAIPFQAKLLPNVLSIGYKIQVQSAAVDTPATPVINYYCFGGNSAPKTLEYYLIKQPAANSSIIGKALMVPTIWVNILAFDSNTDTNVDLSKLSVSGSYRQLRLVKDNYVLSY
jgi:hypothetical protein